MPALRLTSRNYLETFYLLGAGRGYNEAGLQPLLTSEILAYAELTHLHDVQGREKLFRIMRRLDAVFLQYQAEQQRRTQDSSKRWTSGRRVDDNGVTP